MKKAALVFATSLTLAACRGTVPDRDKPSEQGIAAVLIGARLAPSDTTTREALAAVNFEGADGAVYRLPVKSGEKTLYLVEPGTYRLTPTRSVFGFPQKTMSVRADGRGYLTPFPPEILNSRAFEIKPRTITALGLIEIQAPGSSTRFDDGTAARRALIEDSIRAMMDTSRPLRARESAISWSRALQDSLLAIQAEESSRRPAAKK